ncbi:MAG TPA: ABC transporter permease subunit [Clostridia bacterium]|nr:ABC transporter permease subunit [Clostridia bacterium]
MIPSSRAAIPGISRSRRFFRDVKASRYKYLMVLPVLVYLFLFHYKPMFGIVIAFKDYRVSRGIMASPWVGLKHFRAFFSDIYFWRLIRNTVTISGLNILFGFPMPILLALSLNEVNSQRFKRTVQTLSYMPYFISVVVVSGLLTSYCATNGVFNDIAVFLGGNRQNLLMNKNLFYLLYIGSDIWQGIGWNSIIYLAALSSIDMEQYEAARIDGANRFQQMLHITLPGLLPTIVILFILRMGSILSVGSDKILLLYQPLTYEVADVISTFNYRRGLVDADYSFGTAVGLFNSAVNIFFLLLTNTISRRVSENSLF